MRGALTPWTGPRALSPWDVRGPRWFDSLRREMDDLFEQFFGGEAADGGAVFAPRTNLAETDQHYELTVDLPGMKPDDFHVELKDRELWITGERKHEAEEKGKTYHRVERTYGRFRRVISLGADADPEKIDAEYKDGVLRITVAKSEAAQPRKITVKS